MQFYSKSILTKLHDNYIYQLNGDVMNKEIKQRVVAYMAFGTFAYRVKNGNYLSHREDIF